MTDRTKIERVGGHLLIGDAAIPIASIRAFSFAKAKADVQCNVWSDNDTMDDVLIEAHGWTAREILEVAYDSAPDDLTRAGLEMERAKNEEIAVLREALSYAAGKLRADVLSPERDRWARSALARLAGWPDGYNETDAEKGIAMFREAAKVGR